MGLRGNRMEGTASWQPQPGQVWGLTALLVAGAAPHVLRLPVELGLLWLLAVGWRVRLLLYRQPAPAAWLRTLLTAVAAVALYLKFGTVLGREAGGALLVTMAGLKLFELRGNRDALVLVLLAYLLVAVQFMFTQSAWATLYAAAAVLLITTGWLTLQPHNTQPWREHAGLALRLLGQALPLMLVLFLLFPRLPGPLWALPNDAHARTGLSGEMEPGRISGLALSEAVAFRADFHGAIPAPAQRYWRGPVFEFTDGRRWWGATDAADAAASVPIVTRGAAYRYVLTLEPSGTRWLPALELAGNVPADSVRLPSLELRTARALDTLRREEFVSFPDYRVSREHAQTLTRNLQVPAAVGARVRELARRWRSAARNDRAVIAAALRHFNAEPFVYTLNPPPLGAQPVDQFLFDTRRGFCEHYAAAFTLLMRAAGLPARVVTGYQGGEPNPQGGYLIVRQSDAHAWAEVWLNGDGWVRVDPTAAVAPERIERRIDPAWAEAGDAVRFRLDRDGLLAQTLRRARFAVDALDNGWNQWVLDYGAEQQRALLDGFGLHAAGWPELAWLLAAGAGATVAGLAWLLLRRPEAGNPAAEAYRRFCRKLARRGIPAPASEGPRDLLERIAQSHPQTLAAARVIVALYIGLQYAPQPDGRRLKDLRRAVRQFR